VELEAERLERGEAAAGTDPAPPHPPQDLQSQIDALRAQVAAFSRRLDQNQTP
jgi:uncharacterized protein YceH (UPF0502 family)